MVEKKSTKGKASYTDKKEEKLKNNNDIESQQSTNKTNSNNIDWNVAGFISAAITLIGTSVFFLIGWSYERNWSSYYGIDINQLDISLQETLIHGVPTIIDFIALLSVSLFTFRLIYPNLYRIPVIGALLDVEKWISYFMVTVINFWIFIVYEYISFFFISSLDPWEFPAELKYLMGGILAILLLIAISFNVANTKESGPLLTITVYEIILIVSTVYINLLILISISSVRGIIDANEGKRLDGTRITSVYLMSSTPIFAFQDIQISCTEEGNCVYGKFGFVAENRDTFFLVVWPAGPSDWYHIMTWSRKWGIYEIPKNNSFDSYYIIPTSLHDSNEFILKESEKTPELPSYSVTPNPTNTLKSKSTITPTLRPTYTLTPKLTITPTLNFLQP